MSDRKIDITIENTYYNWKIIDEVEPYIKNNNKLRKVKVECICGKVKEIILNTLRTGQSKSCGCTKEYKGRPKGKITFTNTPIIEISLEELDKRVSGDWKVSEIVSEERNENSAIKRIVKILCKHGHERIINAYGLSNLKPCGKCKNIKLFPEETKKIKRKLKGVYDGIIKRCNNTENKTYISYGAKGIKIEKSFNAFSKFLNWSLDNGYKEGLEIDRIDPKKGYCETNCRFITKEENTLRRSDINLTLEDVYWIRSKDFTYEEALNRFTCSINIIHKIREYITFKNI